MASKSVDPTVREAMNLAQAAGWKTSVKNDVVCIQPPGQYPPLTVDLSPNGATLNKWRATARTFGLIGDGPASTPTERDEAAAKAVANKEAAKKAAADKAAQERESAKERAAQIAAVEEKQAAAIAAGRQAPPGLVFQGPDTTPAPAPRPTPLTSVPAQAPATKGAPVAKPAQPTKNADEQGFPVFDPSLLTAVSSDLRLTEGPFKGKYFCPVCWEKGERWLSKLPQGLASHRGFRHGAYLDQSSIGDAAVAQAVVPQNVLTALELLRGELIEGFANLTSAEEIEEAHKKLAQAEELAADLQKKLTQEQADHRETLEKASSWKRTAEARDQKLNEIQNGDEAKSKAAEVRLKALTDQFEKLLREIQGVVQTKAPVQAVGQVDAIVTQYLG